MTDRVITVRVHPGAKRNEVREIMGDGSVKIDIAAPADDGKANDALIRLLADHFRVSKQCVEIVAGHTSRRKLIKITGS